MALKYEFELASAESQIPIKILHWYFGQHVLQNWVLMKAIVQEKSLPLSQDQCHLYL